MSTEAKYWRCIKSLSPYWDDAFRVGCVYRIGADWIAHNDKGPIIRIGEGHPPCFEPWTPQTGDVVKCDDKNFTLHSNATGTEYWSFVETAYAAAVHASQFTPVLHTAPRPTKGSIELVSTVKPQNLGNAPKEKAPAMNATAGVTPVVAPSTPVTTGAPTLIALPAISANTASSKQDPDRLTTRRLCMDMLPAERALYERAQANAAKVPEPAMDDGERKRMLAIVDTRKRLAAALSNLQDNLNAAEHYKATLRKLGAEE